MNSFVTDWEKMYDFWQLTKYEFLNSYSYLTEKEYDDTCMETINKIIGYDEIPIRIHITVKKGKKQNEKICY